MALNVFSGARRIALVIGAVVVGAWIDSIFSYDQSTTLNYTVYLPDKPPELDGLCAGEVYRYRIRTTLSGAETGVRLCFFSGTDDAGEIVLAVSKISHGKYAFSPVTSATAAEYVENYANRFEIDAAGSEKAEVMQKKVRDELYEKIGRGPLLLLGGWLVVAAIGWVVRGFFGIPRGMDARPK